VAGGENGLNYEPFTWSGWRMGKRWCLCNYLIAYDQQYTWVFYNILTRQERKVEVRKNSQGELATFVQFRRILSDRSLRDHDIVEIYFIYPKTLEIWMLDIAVGTPIAIHVSSRLGEGVPVLFNEQFFAEGHDKDAYLSNTCV
jgi:hypothetical protein